MLSQTPFLSPVAQRARRRIMRHILPYLFLLYIIAFLDRVNVGYAALEMTKDLGFTTEVYGFGAGIFFLEGAPAIIFGIATIFYLTDWPHQATWLPDDERAWITTELEKEKQAKKATHSQAIWKALKQREVILLALAAFCMLTSVYGFT